MKVYTMQRSYSIVYRAEDASLKEASVVCPEGISRKEFKDYLTEKYGKILNMTGNGSSMKEYDISQELFNQVTAH